MNPSLHDHKYQRSLADRGAFLEYDMIGMDYFYADQQAQSPCDEENDQPPETGPGRMLVHGWPLG
jgi:phosphotriesterase-related protein